MLPPVCFQTGRFTLTQSSWTVLRRRSRKWMSGQAAALAARTDRSPFTTIRALRKLPSAGGPPSPLDLYLSWISPVFLLKHTHGRYASYGNARQTSSGQVWQGRYYFLLAGRSASMVCGCGMWS